MHRLLLLSTLLLISTAQAQLRTDGATASFRGSLPPKPTAALSRDQEAAIEAELATLTEAFAKVKKHERAADAEIFLKAVRYALDFDEWYDKKPEDGIKKATALLTEAKSRIASLKENKTPWLDGPGQKVLGFYSAIDDSPQPYGVEIPEGLKWGAREKAVPMWIWLHGRGDTATDLHFIYSKLNAKKPGQFQPQGTIVIHPFGRYCNGWKSAGETDVFEARDDAMARFNVDPNRVALAGFSMGGAGAWHMGAHFADQWACVHPGAGFVDVKRYQKITPDKMPVWYEEKLWGVYDVPDYARNFFNVPLVVYSGENDAQRDAAEYMMEVLGREGLKPPHLIGPGMGHKYHPEVIKEVQAKIEEAVAKGRNPIPQKVILQSKAHRYAKMAWVQVLQCEKQWDDTRVEAELKGNGLTVATKNVTAFQIDSKVSLKNRSVTIDGQKVAAGPNQTFSRKDGKWAAADSLNAHLLKAGGTSMEDGLVNRFVIVLPDKASGNAVVDAWVQGESAHFIQRWRSLMRGDPIVMTAAEFQKQPASARQQSVILWGTPQSNPLIADMLTTFPAVWTSDSVKVGEVSFDAKNHILCGAYPGHQRGISRLILNTGLTFREAHDRTNSLQNPKLPDWAILDITTPPTAEAAGKVVAADFFDENWQVRPAKSNK